MGWLSGKSEEERGYGELLEALRSRDAARICAAANRVAEQKLRHAVPLLVPLLYSGNKRVIAAVARALGEIGDLRAMQHLGEAGCAHEFTGGTPGFVTFAEDGGVVEVADEEAAMEKAILEAQQKMWQQPGAHHYLAGLGEIKMYTFGDFWRRNEIFIDPEIQRQPHFPFTIECARRFFRNFAKERFAVQGDVKSIWVNGGKEALPRHSSADALLLSRTLDEMAQLNDAAPERKYKIAEIHFEFGGNAAAPYISVRPEPNWPRPSIVRRCVLDGGAGIRFEEIT
jgi:hypothetical protein